MRWVNCVAELPNTLAASDGRELKPALLAELAALPAGQLPLIQALRSGGYVDTKDMDLTVLGVDDASDVRAIRTGIFFTEIVINCGCGDDPMPIPGYCELLIEIDRQSATARFTVGD